MNEMKYLELFENLDVDGYESITREVFTKECPGWNNPVMLVNTDFYRSKVSHYFAPITPSVDDKLKSMGFTNSNKFASHEITHLTDGGYKKAYIHNHIDIFSLKDEWFYLMVDRSKYGSPLKRKYFKCDQEYGLFNCLKKEFKLK